MYIDPGIFNKCHKLFFQFVKKVFYTIKLKKIENQYYFIVVRKPHLLIVDQVHHQSMLCTKLRFYTA